VCAAQAYPLAHAVQEGSKFALQLGYLVERTAFYSPALWLLRQRIVRVSGGELVRYFLHYGMLHLSLLGLILCCIEQPWRVDGASPRTSHSLVSSSLRAAWHSCTSTP
jgi:Pex2 / Pex12 amino terminal region